MVASDFNLPKFTWVECEPSIKPDCTCRSVYDNFEDILNDFNLTQMVTEPTRQDNILDLILTSNPILVSAVTCIPGLSDHDIVLIEVAVKANRNKQKRRKIHLYNKEDWTTFRSKLKDYQTKFLEEHHGKSVEHYGQKLLKNLINSLISAFHLKSLKANHLFPGSQER